MSKDAIIEVQQTCHLCGGSGSAGRVFSGERREDKDCPFCKGKGTVPMEVQGKFIRFVEEKP